VLRNIIAPSQSKAYIVQNQSNAAVVVKGSATTGVSIAAGKTALVAWNGSDFIEITPSTISSTLPVATGGTGATTLTGVLKGNGTSAFTAATSGTDYSAGTSALATGILKSTTTTGALTIAVAADFPTLNQNTTGTAANLTSATTLPSGMTLVAPLLGTPASGTLTNCTADGTNAVGYKNIPQTGSDKTTAYTLVTGDVGKYVGVGTSGSIVVPTSTFANGDAISIFNNTTGNITITTSAPTAYIAGTNTVKTSITLVTRGIATILFVSATVCVVSGNVL
jgi:hypothetical protein